MYMRNHAHGPTVLSTCTCTSCKIQFARPAFVGRPVGSGTFKVLLLGYALRLVPCFKKLLGQHAAQETFCGFRVPARMQLRLSTCCGALSHPNLDGHIAEVEGHVSRHVPHMRKVLPRKKELHLSQQAHANFAPVWPPGNDASVQLSAG